MTRPSSPQVPYTELQRREAADWFLLIRAGEGPTAESLQAWLRWMDKDEGNRVAFESVAQAWHATISVSALPMPTSGELSADDYDGDQPVDEWLAQRSTVSATDVWAPRLLRSARLLARWRPWFAAACFAVIILSLLIMHRYLDLPGSRSDEFATKAAEQLELTLADGSHVWLGPKSTLIVDFSVKWRHIQLASGEAFFSVRKDRDRPFTVRSTSGDITAVGTASNVRAMNDRVTVAVSEGAVTVAPLAQAPAKTPASVRIASGQQVTFSARESIRAVSITQTPTLGERARWRDGVLVYRDEPLRDVVMDVGRYFGKPIEIAGDAVGNLHYSGVVYKSAIDEWTRALPESFPVKVVSDGSRVNITPR